MAIARTLQKPNKNAEPRTTVKLPDMCLETTTEFLQRVDRIRAAIAAKRAEDGAVNLPSRPAVIEWLVEQADTLIERDGVPPSWGLPSNKRNRFRKE